MNVEIHTSAKADAFVGLFQHIKLFTEHINILFQQDKMFVQGMDASRVSIFEIYLPSGWFDKYELTADGAPDVTLGINVNIFSRVLATRDKTQIIRMQFQDGDDKLYVDYVCPPPSADGAAKTSTTTYDKHFEMPLMDIENEMMSIPDMDSQAEFSVPSVKFALLVDQLKLFGDTIQFDCSEQDGIHLSASSMDYGKMSVEIPIDDLTSFAINEGEQLSLAYSLSHLHNICLYKTVAPEIAIHMSANFPIKMVFASLGGNPDAKIVFYLAPKLSDEWNNPRKILTPLK